MLLRHYAGAQPGLCPGMALALVSSLAAVITGGVIQSAKISRAAARCSRASRVQANQISVGALSKPKVGSLVTAVPLIPSQPELPAGLDDRLHDFTARFTGNGKAIPVSARWKKIAVLDAYQVPADQSGATGIAG